MKSVQIMNRTREALLGTRVDLADSWWQRVRGFLRRPEPQQGQGLLLSPCRAVHMIGMAYPLDILFLDRHGQVVAQYPELKPGRSTSWHARAKYALELPRGTITATGTQQGDHVVWLMTDAVDVVTPASSISPVVDESKNGSHADASANR
jgi:hypothetical protein